jgi:hypothetical protein
MIFFLAKRQVAVICRERDWCAGATISEKAGDAMRGINGLRKRMWLAGLAGTAVTLGLALGAGDEKPPPYPSVSPVLPEVLPPTPVIPGEELKPVSGESVKPATPAPKPVKEEKSTPSTVPAIVPVPKVPDATVPVPSIPAITSPSAVTPPPVVPSVTPPSVAPTVVPSVTPPSVTPTVVPSVTPPVVTVPTATPPASLPSVPAIPIIPPSKTEPTPAKPEITLPTVPATPPVVESKPKPPEMLTTTTTPPVVESKPKPPEKLTTTTTPVAVPTAPPAKKKETEPVAKQAVPPAKAKIEKPKEPGTINISIGATPGVLDNTAKFDAMVTDAKSAYAKISDYSCHFIKQERVRGKMTAEVIHELHARTTPFAAYLKTVQPKEAAGFEMIYVSGKFAMNQVRVKPAGGTFSTVAADDSRANSGRHPADQVGLASVIATIEKQIATERKLGHPVTVSIRDFTYAGKSVIRYELLCDKPHAHRYSHRAVVYIDRETKLPVRFEAYDEPRSGGSPEGDLLETYSFVNLRTNVGHPAAIFER